MKKDLLIGGLFVVLAALGIGAVTLYSALAHKEAKPKTIAPKTEPIALLPKKLLEPAKKEPLPALPVSNKEPIAKKAELEPKKADDKPKVVAKAEPEPKKAEEKLPPPKVEIKKEPMVVAKVEPKKEDKRPGLPVVKEIVFDNVIKLNNPDGEYVVKTLHGGAEIILIGSVKTLKIGAINERSVLDATRLVAEEIVFTGNINSRSKVLLGKAQTLRIRDINDQSLLDASALEAKEIFLTGSVNGRSTLKLHAPKGTVEIFGEINDNAEIDIAAPDGKILFKSNGDSVINGNAKLTLIAREVELRGNVNPATITLTLTKDGVLKARRLGSGVRLLYSKADAGDPPLRIEPGLLAAGAILREMAAGRK